MIKGQARIKSRDVWDEIYANWYNRSIDGVYRINSKTKVIIHGNYQALEYCGFKILELFKGEGIRLNSAGYNGKLFSLTDANYIRACGYEFKYSKGKVTFEGTDVTAELEDKGTVMVGFNGAIIIKASATKANMLKALKRADDSLNTTKKAK